MKLTINNIKCRFKVIIKDFKRKISYIELYFTVKTCGNITSIRTGECVYIIFNTSGHVNICGIKYMSDIQDRVRVFLLLFSMTKCSSPINVKIDNISANGYFSRPIFQNISVIKDFANTINGSVSFPQGRFPGITVRTKFGTIIIFQSGKINVVGLKSVKSISVIEKKLELLEDFTK